MAAEKYDYPKEAMEYYGNLKNITKTSDAISAEYYPEGKKIKGFMKIGLNGKEVIEHDNVSSFAAPHVRRELIRLAKMEEVPKEKQCYGIKRRKKLITWRIFE